MMIRDIRTLKKSPPVLRVRRGPPLFGGSLKIHTGDNANLATEDIRFCWEREILAIFNNFKEHFAESSSVYTITFIFFFLFLLFIKRDVHIVGVDFQTAANNELWEIVRF